MEKKKPYYIYDIPVPIRFALVDSLDINDAWRRLAAEADFSIMEISMLANELRRPGGSPSEQLLYSWGTKNATIKRLFEALGNIGRVTDMRMIMHLVPPEYHHMVPHDDDVDRIGELKLNGSADKFPDDDLPLPGPNDPVENSLGSTPPLGACVEASLSTGPGSSVNYDKNATGNGPPSSNCKVPDKTIELDYSSAPRRTVPNMSVPSFVPDTYDDSCASGMAVCRTPHFKYIDIQQATKNFHPACKIGEGAFGTVFKGSLHKTMYAIKVFSHEALHLVNQEESRNHWKAEISTLMMYRHLNIVQLCGFSLDGPFTCLLFDYMVNGSLEDRLECKNGTPPLTWLQRSSICLGSAKGINFLHAALEKPLIHGDIKSANVLLDKHFDPKIADFGLAVQATKRNEKGKYTHITRENKDRICATYAYLPPDFPQNMQYSIKSDVYSFGVVLFEICTGLKALDNNRKQRDLEKLVDYVEEVLSGDDDKEKLRLTDSRLGDWARELVDKLMHVGLACTKRRKKDRPEMKEVVEMLEQLDIASQRQNHQRRPESYPEVSSTTNAGDVYHNNPHRDHGSFYWSHHSVDAANLMAANHVSHIPETVYQNTPKPTVENQEKPQFTDDGGRSLSPIELQKIHDATHHAKKPVEKPDSHKMSPHEETENVRADDPKFLEWDHSKFPDDERVKEDRCSPMQLQMLHDAEKCHQDSLKKKVDESVVKQVNANPVYQNQSQVVDAEDKRFLDYDRSKLPGEDGDSNDAADGKAVKNMSPRELELEHYRNKGKHEKIDLIGERRYVNEEVSVNSSVDAAIVERPSAASEWNATDSVQPCAESNKAKKKLPFALEEYYEEVSQDMACMTLDEGQGHDLRSGQGQQLPPPAPCPGFVAQGQPRDSINVGFRAQPQLYQATAHVQRGEESSPMTIGNHEQNGGQLNAVIPPSTQIASSVISDRIALQQRTAKLYENIGWRVPTSQDPTVLQDPDMYVEHISAEV